MVQELLLLAGTARQLPAGNLSYARPKAANTLRACSGSKRSTSALFSPSSSRISKSCMKRLAATQKSSRTRTTHCTRPTVTVTQSLHQLRVLFARVGHAATARTGPAPQQTLVFSGTHDPSRIPASTSASANSSGIVGTAVAVP